MTERGIATRERLIAATTKLVQELGYANVTTRAIAREAGVAEGTLYRHYPDKTALFFAAVLSRHGPMLQSVAGLDAMAGSGTVSDNLLRCLTRLSELRSDLIPLELAVLADPALARNHPGRDGANPASIVGPPAAIAGYLAAEQQQGRIRSDVDVSAVAIVLLAMLFGLAVSPISTVGSAVDVHLLRAAVGMVMNGIAPAAAASANLSSTAAQRKTR